MKYSEPKATTERDLVEQAASLLPEIGKLLYAAVARHPEAAGRPLGQIKLMFHLCDHQRRTVGEIATGLGVSMPTASELVDRLVEEGMLERTANPDDRRQVLVGLTPAAWAFATRLGALRRAQLRDAMERLAPEERPVFVRSLEALVEALRQNPDQLPAEPDPEPGHASSVL